MTQDNSAYKKAYGKWAGRPDGNPPDYDRCCVEVFDRYGHQQCTRKRGCGPGEAYCKQHDPEAAKAREDARTAKWQAKWQAEQKKWADQRLGLDAVEALRLIAAGHNDPCTLAHEILDPYDEKYPPEKS